MLNTSKAQAGWLVVGPGWWGDYVYLQPPASDPLLSVALNSSTSPSSLTKTLTRLLLWLDCQYLCLKSFHSAFCSQISL